MPAPIYYAHKILKDLADARKAKSGDAAKLGPDAKSQVTVRYVDGRPVEATQIVLSTQHLDESLDSAAVRAIVEPYIRAALPENWVTDGTVWARQPDGKFVIGGPDGDAGLTGRKIIVDTYGGAAPMAAAPSRARIRPRSTARRPMRRATSQERTSSPPARPQGHDPARLRHRRRQAAVDLRRPARHRRGRRGQARVGPGPARRPVAPRHPHPSRPQQADLRPHLGLRPFRPRAEADGGFSWERTDSSASSRAPWPDPSHRPESGARSHRDRAPLSFTFCRRFLSRNAFHFCEICLFREICLAGRRHAPSSARDTMDDHDTDAGPERARAFYGRRKGKRLRPGQEERLADLLPRLRLPEAGRLDPLPCFPVRSPRPGSRSASAAASTSPPRPASIPAPGSSAASPSSTAW